MRVPSTEKNLAFLVSCVVFLWMPIACATPRSDARILHVDFENYMDGIVQPLNAGIRWLGDPFSDRDEGTVSITKGFGFSGSRCGHVKSDRSNQIARIRLQRRFDAPKLCNDEVIELVFRVSRTKPVDLEGLLVCSVRSKAGQTTGIEILANGMASAGTYQLVARNLGEQGNEENENAKAILAGLDQTRWIRIIQHRRRQQGVVDIWAGPPQEEIFLGTFPDPNSKAVSYSMELGDGSTSTCRGAGYWDDIRIGGVLQAGSLVANPEPPLRDVSQEIAQQQLPIPVGSARQLFVDDAIIESMKGLKRTLHPIKKHPSNPLIVPKNPWEGKSVLLYGAVIRDLESQKLRMWYLAWGKQIGQPSYICYAESDDGIRWNKPNLGLVEHEGSKNNNILMPGWSQTTVLYDPSDEDPTRRYKAVLRLNGTRGFFSSDGIHWRDEGIIIDQAYDGTSVHWDPVNQKWIAMVKIFRDGKRARGYAESKDFLNWTDTYYMMTVDEQDRAGDQMYSQYMFHYETAYFGLLRMYHTDSDIVDIQLTTSRNAKHWERSIRQPFIPTSQEVGTWDFANNSVPSTPPIRVGNELWFYYAGRSVLHNVSPNDGAIGLGTLRVDGFFSMDASDTEGVLTTKPLRLQGNTLHVNAAAAKGSIWVEILDESKNLIGPHSAGNCRPLESDKIRHSVYWEGNKSLNEIGNRDVRLRFRMKNAALYSFWTE
jgi:hypothetical protein